MKKMFISFGVCIYIQYFIGVQDVVTNKYLYYNLDHNILRLLDVLPNFPFTTSETDRDY